MVDYDYLCTKCNRSISINNKTLHEAQCKETSQFISNNLNDLKYCKECDNYLPINIYNDHLLSHEIVNENSYEDIQSNDSLDQESGRIIIKIEINENQNPIISNRQVIVNHDGSTTTIIEQRHPNGGFSRNVVISSSNNNNISNNISSSFSNISFSNNNSHYNNM
jgi:hypothetical protein